MPLPSSTFLNIVCTAVLSKRRNDYNPKSRRSTRQLFRLTDAGAVRLQRVVEAILSSNSPFADLSESDDNNVCCAWPGVARGAIGRTISGPVANLVKKSLFPCNPKSPQGGTSSNSISQILTARRRLCFYKDLHLPLKAPARTKASGPVVWAAFAVCFSFRNGSQLPP